MLHRAPQDQELLLALSEAELTSGDPQAGEALAAGVAADPSWVEGQSALAALRWESGDTGGFTRGMEGALRRFPGDPGLWNAYIGALAGSGNHLAAANAAAAARAAGFQEPILRLIEAAHAGTAGHLDRAESLLATIPDAMPEKPPNLVRHWIRKGALPQASVLIERLTAAQPGNLALWALAELVWRAIGDPRASWLSGDPRFIGILDLPLDSEATERLARLLRGLHAMRAQPIGQSVRNGTQTRGRLFDRGEPGLHALRTILQDAVDAHLKALPPTEPGHPLLRHRDRAVRVAGGWSVRLGGSGHHVSHIHPAGILSSATYIAVPDTDPGSRDGWLELGRPPADLRLDLAPLATIEPRVGRLVLFPSYLYHGTRPFRAGERLSVAFDAA